MKKSSVYQSKKPTRKEIEKAFKGFKIFSRHLIETSLLVYNLCDYKGHSVTLKLYYPDFSHEARNAWNTFKDEWEYGVRFFTLTRFIESLGYWNMED